MVQRENRLYGTTDQWPFNISGTDGEKDLRKDLGLEPSKETTVPNIILQDIETTMRCSTILFSRLEHLQSSCKGVVKNLFTDDGLTLEKKLKLLDDLFDDQGQDLERLNRQHFRGLANLTLARRDAILNKLKAPKAAKNFLRQAPLFDSTLFGEHLHSALFHGVVRPNRKVGNPHSAPRIETQS